MSRCAIDQIQTVAGFRCQLVEESLPDAPARPAVEPIVGCCVRPVAFRQIAPRHTRAQHVEDRIQDPTIIDTRALAVPREQRLEKCPFLIAQIKSHDPPPPAVNHDPPCYSVNYLSTDPSLKGWFPSTDRRRNPNLKANRQHRSARIMNGRVGLDKFAERTNLVLLLAYPVLLLSVRHGM